MGSDRFNKVGIQRELHIDWFDHAARVYAAGVLKKEARQEFYSYLDNAPGFDVQPSLQTKTYVANVLIKTWVMPESCLIPLREAAFELLHDNQSFRFALHWCLLGAAYPFWYSVAAIAGRLLNLQDQVTQLQVVSRLKEKYGDRQTISRRARYVIRSFVAWGVLKDSGTQGCYERAKPMVIADFDLAGLMFESALRADPKEKCALGLMLNNPAFFPFQFPVITGDLISQHNNRIDVLRYGMDDVMLGLRA